ncbi:MAG: tRNA (guanosine(37)-N1)-methyltransferase TrmD [Pseudomonadota bacterium]
MAWQAQILTLYPDMFPGPLGLGVIGRGLSDGHWSLSAHDIRDHADNRYGSVDDTPAGGGAGLVMRADILLAALDGAAARTDMPADMPIVCPSPRGTPFDQTTAQRLAAGPGAVFVCGRFEGIDERFFDARPIEEISVGDFVLAGGEIAAMAMVEACVRLIPGVLGSAQSLGEESFTQGLLEYPQYTRPRTVEGLPVPAVLQSGNHKKIAEWRHRKAEEITRTRRPDLFDRYQTDKNETENGPIARPKNNRKTKP